VSRLYAGHCRPDQVKGDYLKTYLAYQKQQPVGLIENSYLSHGHNYYDYLLTGFSWYYPETQPSINAISAFCIKAAKADNFEHLDKILNEKSKVPPILFNTAIINLTKVYEDNEQPVSGKFLRQAIYEFYQETGTLASIGSHKIEGDKKPTDCVALDKLLLCHPVDHRSYDLGTYKENRKIEFFTFMMDKGIITLDQLEQSNAMLGSDYHHMLQQKEQRDLKKMAL
jgi:hypothetical protein